MKLCCDNAMGNRRALTVVEVLLILGAVFFFIILLLPGHLSKKSRPTRSMCRANMKQVSLAFILWMEDNKTTKFPWEIDSPTGTLQHATSPHIFRHFMAVSNQLQNPQALVCPGDKARKSATSWSVLQNKNISYFISLAHLTSYDLTNLQVVTSGDRNLSTNHTILSGIHEMSDPSLWRWTKDIHQHVGNIALIDGSVHTTTILGVQSRFTNPPVRLAFP